MGARCDAVVFDAPRLRPSKNPSPPTPPLRGVSPCVVDLLRALGRHCDELVQR
jgi:hypothetical protein